MAAALRLLSSSACFKRPLLSLISSSAKQIVEIPKLKDAVIFRNMSSHHRVMETGASKFEWKKFMDHWHFYCYVGIVPIVVIITVTNIFIGPAELADIPEGYEPKHWEYYQHPISRFISRTTDSQEKKYERNLHFIAKDQDVVRMRKLERKVKSLEGSPDLDYHKKWYLVPLDMRPTMESREKALETKEYNSKFPS